MFFDHPLAKGTILSETPHYHGPIFDVVTQNIKTPDGLTVQRDLIRHANAVAMLALTDDGRVLVNREYRVAVNREVYALPAGLMDPGEDWATAASRELQEETGYIIKKVTQGCEYGNTGQHAALYVAADNRIDDTA